MTRSYSTIAWGASVDKGVQPDVQYGYKATTTAGTVFNIFNALGTVAFAYAGHNVVLEIQATMPSTPENPSKAPMWKGVIAAYVAIAICYFPVALIGFWIFGNEVNENIFIALEKPVWLIAMANLFVVVHLIGGYQVLHYTDLYFNFITWSSQAYALRMIAAFTMFFAITFPFFAGLLGFFGGFSFAPTTYFLPCIMWLAIYKPKKFSLSWFANWICIVFGVVLMIMAPIGGLKLIIDQAKGYKFYS
ncbi:lysine histidine transporter 1-like [Olea europaea subsp. europaea]|uniref:Lysine histidine transporter 1-like n=1 Tax=Olea europaea subsp. europaea TaxID=158383 RepID=A0A8S0TJQ2_OLEEU|nr:lysine histidine transporter 1-like [Olea europaea subsp. europaea]